MTSLKIMKKKLSRKLRIAKKQVKKLTIRMKKLQRKKTKTKKKRRRRKRTRSRTKVQKGGLPGFGPTLQKKWKGCLRVGSGATPNGCDWMGKFAFKDAMQKEIPSTTDAAAFAAYAQLVNECVMNANAKNSDGKTNCRPQAKIGVYAPKTIGPAPLTETGSPW